MLLDNEIEETYANQLVEELDGSVKPDMPIDYLLSVVYQKMVLKFGQTKTIQSAEKGPKLVYFIGPTGVGKTTTIAKIASRLSVVEKKKIVLLTADTYRIAAAEQLRTYANILEVPFRIIYTPQEIRTAIEDYAAYDYIFRGYFGHSQKNTDQRDDTLALLRAADGQAEKGSLSGCQCNNQVQRFIEHSRYISEADRFQTGIYKSLTRHNVREICLICVCIRMHRCLM